jgi:voltage-gated potassium channel
MRLPVSRIFSSNYLNAKLAFLVFTSTLLIGFYGFKTIENLNWIDAMYMTIITFSTVGFETVHVMSQPGKVFASFIIILNIASFAYALSVFSYYFIEGKFFQKMKNDIIKNRISRLTDHIIVCGMGRYGEEIIRHFILHKMNFVIIEKDEERIQELQGEFNNLLCINEDATHDDVLVRAGIDKASAIIIALPDDSDNLFTVLSARQLNPDINIISRAYETKSIRKIKLAGADHVIMPEHIGGFYMATLVSKPDAVEFFSFITNEATSDIGFEEIGYDDLQTHYKDLKIRDMKIREKTGANVIGFKDSNGKYFANPEPETVLSAGTSFIILGSKNQLSKFRELMKG